eukprot:Hpha_TRINITY_DN11656_c0_g3::TRINITY_DN11656_c0_g3_i1::g.49259::m.49259
MFGGDLPDAVPGKELVLLQRTLQSHPDGLTEVIGEQNSSDPRPKYVVTYRLQMLAPNKIRVTHSLTGSESSSATAVVTLLPVAVEQMAWAKGVTLKPEPEAENAVTVMLSKGFVNEEVTRLRAVLACRGGDTKTLLAFSMDCTGRVMKFSRTGQADWSFEVINIREKRRFLKAMRPPGRMGVTRALHERE